MKLTFEGIRDRAPWEGAGIRLPSFDPKVVAERTRQDPRWIHFGIGNIFRVFLGGAADRMIEEGVLDRGISCAELFDLDVPDLVYRPFDNLVLSVILHSDGRKDLRVLGSLSEAVKGVPEDREGWARMKEIFDAPGLQLASFTITEKGYALRGPDGTYLSAVQKDLENGPRAPKSAMGIVAAMLLERYRSGAAPIAMVSMDNVSRNGEKLRAAVLEMAKAWKSRSFVEDGFLQYVSDSARVSFPWTMIDKITPRPDEAVSAFLKGKGIRNMDVCVTGRKTWIAPFVNAEAPEYLVIEDSFPNGRPPFERAGIYMTDRETVNRSERMKVTVCLNPIHTALCTYDCLLGYTLFADGMRDPDLFALASQVGYREGLAVVQDPGILSPKAFLDELMTERFPNPYLGDTAARIAVDISQMVGIRFGETIRAYVAKDGDASALTGIPLAIAGWIRYLMAVDDRGKAFSLSPDPMLPELTDAVKGLRFGEPSSLQDQLRGILSNPRIFESDLYAVGIGEKIEAMVREQLAGPGAVRAALRKYLYP